MKTNLETVNNSQITLKDEIKSLKLISFAMVRDSIILTHIKHWKKY